MMKNNAMIFGDSYSTFKGFIPQAYAAYYSEEGRPETDVTKVTETWWYQVFEKAGLDLVLNDSWSGSTIGHTRYDGIDCSKTSSFIYRLRRLIERGFFAEHAVDTVFVFGGTNDSWADVPLGEEKLEDWEEQDLFEVLPAVSYFLKLVRDTVPNAKIYCLINTELKPEIDAHMKNACARYGITPIAFEHIDKNCGHPTIQGMKDIKEKVLEVMSK
ncbi:MAG: hypothetical protein IJO88_02970 [Oscillospiraceae bacterium]|nr:hypothetical protein [Oscillospiraceae bacterium]